MDMKRELRIVYDDSPDGLVASQIARKFLAFTPDYTVDNVIYTPVNFDSRIKHETGDCKNVQTLCLVGFTPRIGDMESLITSVGINNIYWFDYNASNIERYEKYFVGRNEQIKGLRVPEVFSSAELAYLYFVYDAHVPMNPINGRPTLNHLYTKGLTEDDNFSVVNVTVDSQYKKVLELFPWLLKKIGDYTTLRDISNETIDFKCWFETRNNDFDNEDFYDMFLDNEFLLDGASFDMIYNTIMTDGEINRICLSRQNIRNLTRYSYECKLRKFEDIKCIAINHPLVQSDIFRMYENDYELGIIYCNLNDHMVYSIHRLKANPNKYINCKYIAESFGGIGRENQGCFSTSGVLVVTPVINDK